MVKQALTVLGVSALLMAPLAHADTIADAVNNAAGQALPSTNIGESVPLIEFTNINFTGGDDNNSETDTSSGASLGSGLTVDNSGGSQTAYVYIVPVGTQSFSASPCVVNIGQTRSCSISNPGSSMSIYFAKSRVNSEKQYISVCSNGQLPTYGGGTWSKTQTGQVYYSGIGFSSLSQATITLSSINCKISSD